MENINKPTFDDLLDKALQAFKDGKLTNIKLSGFGEYQTITFEDETSCLRCWDSVDFERKIKMIDNLYKDKEKPTTIGIECWICDSSDISVDDEYNYVCNQCGFKRGDF